MRYLHWICTGGLALSSLVTGECALAQAGTYPTKPVTLVLPYSSGGSTDIEARLHATKC